MTRKEIVIAALSVMIAAFTVGYVCFSLKLYAEAIHGISDAETVEDAVSTEVQEEVEISNELFVEKVACDSYTAMYNAAANTTELTAQMASVANTTELTTIYEEAKEDITVPTEEEVEEEEKIIFRVTAYCSCSKCCGKWSENRPKDENGNEIVYGAAMKPLTAWVSCASPLPFGTKISLGDLGVFVVQDRTAQWVVDKYGKYIVDIYVSNHEDIDKIGCQRIEGVILE